ncbi:hypothetical protein [Agarivorans albus]|uniref:Capsule polysaccharide biosynthesis protein n=1 Tax=Agarivorans albus MKT 106 TaxID=1331007 RepID=R9PN70_AGAAL|nr:hypothetical protein [Agarivorans albus]GAD02750.1 hypothetical protein AALB_2830 [Agarivorans albus MKT 106]
MLKKIFSRFIFRIKKYISNRKMVEHFESNNGKFWTNLTVSRELNKSSKTNQVVLVEISEKNPFELESNMRVAKTIELNSDLVIEALVACTLKVKEPYVKLVKSYNIARVIALYRVSLLNLFRLIYSLYVALSLFRKIKTLDDIEELTYNGVVIGDLVYDTYIRMQDGKFSPSKDYILLKYITHAIFNCQLYTVLLGKGNVKYLVVADKCYINHGVLYRVAIKFGVKVLMPTKELKWLNAGNIKKHFHHPELSLDEMKLELKDVEIEKQVSSYFSKRFSGEIDQIDVLSSYRNKRVYARDELMSIMSLVPGKKNVLIMPHAFSDFPHIAEGLYNDYYIWLVELLKVVKDINNVNWLIKPHPTSYIFNEIGVVETLLNDIGATNVKVVPKDMNTASVKDLADVILTVRGTPGLEFATFGIPVVTAGEGCYSGYGIDITTSSKQDYVNTIRNVTNIPRLDEAQISNAKMVFYYLFIKPNAMLTYLMKDIESNMSDYNKVLNNILDNNNSELIEDNVLYGITLKMLNQIENN